MKRCVKNGQMCMYFLCDLNGRSLKDSSILCCIYILLESVEGRIVDIVQVGSLFETVFLHLF
jgi:hypothetical protein